MDWRGREAATAGKLQGLGAEARVPLNLSLDNRCNAALRSDLDQERIKGARAEAMKFSDVALSPQVRDGIGCDKGIPTCRNNAEEMPGDNGVSCRVEVRQVLTLLVPAHSADLASGDGIGRSPGRRLVNSL